MEKRSGREYALMAVEDLREGLVLDQGAFKALEAGHEPAEGYAGTWTVRLQSGRAYTETRGAQVRVWVI